jgi:hypothetical protein
MDKGLSSSLRTNSCCLIHKMSVKNVPEKRAAESWRSGPGCAMIDRALAWTPLRNGVFIAARRCRRRGRPGIPATLVAAFAAGVAVWERCGSYGSSVLRCMLGFGARASAVEDRQRIKAPAVRRFATPALERIALSTPACSSPPSVSLRPRVVARSSMSCHRCRRRGRTGATRNAPGSLGARFSK